jgi:hypothetical protein
VLSLRLFYKKKICDMKTLEKIYAEKLLRIKAIKLQPSNPFTWASGWKSPFYCDNRKTLSYPGLRDFIKIELKSLLTELNKGELNKDEKRVVEVINCALSSVQIGVHYNMTGVKLFIKTAQGE